MKQSVVLLFIAIFGLPVLARDKTHQATDKVCVAEHGSAMSALVKDRDIRRRGVMAPSAEQQRGLLATLEELQAEADDRSYLVETAHSSATLTRQGPATAVARINPRFAARLASAIREARGSGLPSAGIFSAYRPPSFGVGRFLDRFNSLHAYGLAVDMFGIGEPGSKEAKLWYDIVGRHGIFCPYGVDSRREWNHCQPTQAKAVCRDSPLRKTITAEGPIDLEEMFKVGDEFVDNPPATCIVVAANRPAVSDAPHETIGAAVATPARSGHKDLHAARSVAADGITPHAAPAASASAHSDRKHSHEARDVASNAFTRGRRSRDDELTRLVAHDMGLGLGRSHPKGRRHQ